MYGRHGTFVTCGQPTFCILVWYLLALSVHSWTNCNNKGRIALVTRLGVGTVPYASQSPSNIRKTPSGNSDDNVIVNIDSKLNHILHKESADIATSNTYKVASFEGELSSNSTQHLFDHREEKSHMHLLTDGLIGSILSADKTAKQAFRYTKNSIWGGMANNIFDDSSATDTSSSHAINSSDIGTFFRNMKVDDKFNDIRGVIGSNIEKCNNIRLAIGSNFDKWRKKDAQKSEDDALNEILAADLFERTKENRASDVAENDRIKTIKKSSRLVVFLEAKKMYALNKASQLFPLTTKVITKVGFLGHGFQAIRGSTMSYAPHKRLWALQVYATNKMEPLSDALRYAALRAYLEATEYAPLLNYLRSAYRRRSSGKRVNARGRNIVASADFALAADTEDLLSPNNDALAHSRATRQDYRPLLLAVGGGGEAQRDESSLFSEQRLAGKEKDHRSKELHKDHTFMLKQQYFQELSIPVGDIATTPPQQWREEVAQHMSPKAPPFAEAISGAEHVYNVLGGLLSGSAPQLTSWPAFSDLPQVPQPSTVDIMYLEQRMQQVAIEGATEVSSAEDATVFIKNIGLKPLIDGVLAPHCHTEQQQMARVKAVKGLCTLVKHKKHLADNIALIPELTTLLIEMIELPLHKWHSVREVEALAQTEALNFILRLVRSSDQAVKHLMSLARLKKALSSILNHHEDSLESSMKRAALDPARFDLDHAESPGLDHFLDPRGSKTKDKFSNTRVVDNHGLDLVQKARIALWALGGVPWKPKQPGQRGLRILSFDGGGTRGVLTIALLKQLMERLGMKYPHEVFDIICGTSTGGIIAYLLGGNLLNVDKTETLYDSFIHKVFSSKSNLKLVTEQASYDEMELEKILHSFTGEDLVVDTNKNDCPRVFCVSTKLDNNPPQIQLFRNYNYPKGQSSRYGGSFQANALTAIRATTAAPTFFTPVQWEGGLYCDGALVANNPTAVALQEAKALYPSVPIEYVVSIGTGIYNNRTGHDAMNWDLLVNQIIASSVDTEDVHTLLKDFLPEEKYLRINPGLADNLPIDTTDPAKLLELKRLAKQLFDQVDGSAAGGDYRHLNSFIDRVKRSNNV